MRSTPLFGLGLIFATLAAFGVSAAGDKAGDKIKVDPAALERTRQSIMMLDDLYKNAVVIITKTYTDKQSDTPAAVVAIELFEAMHKKGWHSARLVDATGKPKNKANAAKTDFEKRGVEQMNAGKAYFEEIGEKDGKAVLRVATVVPALMTQCITCHGGKQGRVLGALVYELPIK